MSDQQKSAPKTPAPLPILQVLANLRGGSIMQETQEELEKLAKAVSLIGKGGSITLKIGIRPAGEVAGALFVAAELSSKIPKPARGADMLYADGRGGLYRSDPRQFDAFESMKPRIVGGATVSTSTGEILDDQASA